jgi:hypothetical protein
MQATLPRAERAGKGGRARTAPQPNARITSSPKRPSTFQFRDHGHPRSRRGGSPGRVLQRKPVGRPKVIKGTVPSVPSRLGNRTLPACPHVRAARRDHQPAGRPGAAGGSAGRMVGVVCAGMVAHRPRGEAVQGAPIGPAFQTSAPRAKIKQTVRKLPEFGVKQREERAVRESERLGLIGRVTRPKAPRTPVGADRAA